MKNLFTTLLVALAGLSGLVQVGIAMRLTGLTDWLGY
jgi:hypothetical protein